MLLPFTPGATVTVAVTVASAATAMSKPDSRQVMITSAATSALAFIAFGDSTVAATVAASCPILAGTAQVFTVPAGATHIAAITGATTATLYVTSGDGV